MGTINIARIYRMPMLLKRKLSISLYVCWQVYVETKTQGLNIES